MFSNEVTCLQRITMFRDVDVAKLKLIAMSGQRVHYAPGDVILRQGDSAKMVFVVMDGEADVLVDVEGAQVKLLSFGNGALVGEVGAVLDKPYPNTIVARTAVTALQIDQSTFLDLLNQVPQLSMALIKELSRRLILASDLYSKAVS